MDQNDELIDLLAWLVNEQDKMEHVENPHRKEQFLSTFKVLKHICRYDKIYYKIDDPFKGMGVITLEGTEVKIINTKAFESISKIADNMEFGALVDGTVRLDVTFHGLSDIVAGGHNNG